MRLFVGITPNSEAISHAAGAVDRIASTTPDVRWVPPQRWHVTLAFLGEVKPDRVPALAARLDAVAAAHEPLEGLRLAGAGTFRGILWLGIADAELRSESALRRHLPIQVRLEALAEEVQRAMRAAGATVERRPWRPHLTIGRWRPSPERDAAAQRAEMALADYAGPAFDVQELQLVHSVTGPQPEYRDLHVVRLSTGSD